jgi:transposase-like protein
MEKELNINKFHAYWQCPSCHHVNMEAADIFLLKIKKFKCKKCNNNYRLKEKVVQILCEVLEI